MNKLKKHYLIKSFLLIFLLIGIIVPVENKLIAVTTKAKGDVTFRSRDSKDYNDLKPAKTLNDGDHIQTGNDGFGALVYLDDKSTIKVKENTDFDVIGTRGKEGISKRIKINAGAIKVKIPKGSAGGFIIETPTSVATVKGTEFWLVTSTDGDQVFGLEGSVELKNTISGEVVMVGVNETGTSLATGEVNVAETIPEDVPTEAEEEEINEFEVEFEGPDGDQKTMKIRYR